MDTPPANLHRVASLLDLRRPQEALDLLASVGEAGGSAEGQCLRARAYLALDRLEEAGQAASAARAADVTENLGYRLGALVALRRARLSEARTLAKEAVRLAPHDEYAHYVAALVMIASGDLTQARTHSERMLSLAPGLALAHQMHGRVLLAQDDVQGAERALRESLALDPQDAATLSLLSDVRQRLGDAEGSAQLRLSAVRADPQDADLQRKLLKSGAAMTFGGIAVIGKLGMLKYLFAASALQHVGDLGGSPHWRPFGIAVAVVLAVRFVVSRIRRYLRGRSLPRRVWQGLAATRRNQDLLWLAWPSGVVLLAAGIIATVRAVGGGQVGAPLGTAGCAAAVLAGCWGLRQGSAKDLTPRDVLADAGEFVRFLAERQRLAIGRLFRSD